MFKSKGKFNSLLMVCLCLLAVCLWGQKELKADGASTIDISESFTFNKPRKAVKNNPRILFIGNSYSMYNDFTGMVKELSKAGGFTPHIDKVFHSRYTLAWFANPKDSYGARVYKKLKNEKWDYVVLQDRSFLPITDAQSIKTSISKLLPYIKKAGAQPVLLMTWAPQEGHEDYQGKYKSINRKQYQTMVAETYIKLGKKFQTLVSPAGIAFWQFDQQDTDVDLYGIDYNHPSKAGSYLSACVLYATIYQKSPIGLKSKYISDEEIARSIQIVAAQVVLGEVDDDVSSGLTEPELKKTISMREGKFKKLHAGMDLEEMQLTWKSDNSNIAVVDQNGLVTAKRTGIAYIAVSSDLGVSEVYPVAVSPKKVTLGAGEKYDLNTGLSFKWKSSNKKIADVRKGKITAKRAGTATLTAYGPGKIKLTCKVKVKKAPSKVGLKIKKTMKVGAVLQLKTVFPKGSYSNKMKYRSSNSRVAKVDRYGMVTARRKGKVVITAIAYNGVKSTCEIQVKK